jgi:aldehyde dehydrogenase (NAD+)
MRSESRSYAARIGTESVTTGETFTVTDPATGQPLAEVTEGGEQGIDRAIRAAEDALAEWQSYDASKRGRILRGVADRIRENGERLAEVETAETGRPISHSRVWATQRTPDYFEYYAGLADKIEGETIPIDGDAFDFTLREPIGVTGHIIPWNASLLLGCRSIAPALACGNAVVAKPAPEAPLSLLELADIIADTELPDGIFSVVPGDGPNTGAALTTDDRIAEITFTGSRETGRTVMKAAAERIAPVSLELGGKSPAVVFPDADIEAAAADTAKVFWNAGQVCFATTRVFVHAAIYEEFLDALVAEAESMTIGAGEDDPDLGPLISAQARDTVAEYVDSAIDNGARLRTGGEPLAGDGHFYAPTILDEVDDDEPISCDEVFGPVLTTYEFETEQEVIERANDTDYGLYAAVWTKDVDRVHRLIRAIEAGTVAVNQFPATANQAPFGGYKQSGLGRVNGQQAIERYTRTKNAIVNVVPTSE